MALKFLLVIISVIISFEGIASNSNTENYRLLPHAEYIVSLLDLIVRPEEFNKKEESLMQVSGFLGKRSILYLFLTSEHEKIDDRASAIPLHLSDSEISLESSQCIGKFVSIIGQFKKDHSGQYGISNIVQVNVPAKDWGLQPCWEVEIIMEK